MNPGKYETPKTDEFEPGSNGAVLKNKLQIIDESKIEEKEAGYL